MGEGDRHSFRSGEDKLGEIHGDLLYTIKLQDRCDEFLSEFFERLSFPLGGFFQSRDERGVIERISQGIAFACFFPHLKHKRNKDLLLLFAFLIGNADMGPKPEGFNMEEHPIILP